MSSISSYEQKQDVSAAARESGAPNRTLAQWVWAAARRLWVPIDFAGAAAAVTVAYAVAPHRWDRAITEYPLTATFLHAGVFVLVLYLFGLYDRNCLNRPVRMSMRAGVAAAIASALTLALFYLLFFQPIGRWVMAAILVFSVVVAVLPRLLFWSILRRRRRRILFLGKSDLTQKVIEALARDFSGIYKVVQAESIEEGQAKGVDEIILPMDFHPREQTLGTALQCVSSGCQVRSVADLYEDLFRRVPVSSEVPLTWLFGLGWDSTNHFVNSLKRLNDLVLAAIALALSAPFWLIAPILVKLSSPGPVFYIQFRVGQYGRLFRIVKFRTMPADAENDGAQWSEKNDPRPTLLGKFLRKSRIDEIPQLLNILRGHMSFVGPRPERPEFTAKLEAEIPYYAFRHLVRPGLTGWAQVNYRYGSSVADAWRKLEYDLYYVRHISLLSDLGIVLRTVTSVMKGAR